MSAPEAHPKRKRRWLRFGLRSFFVLLTIGCLLLGYWVHRAERQRAVVKWVEQKGGTVNYGFEFGPDGRLDDDHQPPFFYRMFGPDYFSPVIVVSMHGRHIDNVDPLSQLDQLERAYLEYTAVSDISPLADLPELTELFLSGTDVADLRPLAGNTRLQRLHLGFTNVTDVGPLAHVESLRTLDLEHTSVTDISPLANLAHLEKLYLSGSKVRDVTPLEQMSSLRTVGASDTPITSSQLEALADALPACEILRADVADADFR
jgi:hypothetical protein